MYQYGHLPRRRGLTGPVARTARRRADPGPSGAQLCGHQRTRTRTRTRACRGHWATSARMTRVRGASAWTGARQSASETVCKPSPVPPLARRRRSSIWDRGCPRPRAADPRTRRRRPVHARPRAPCRSSYLALHQVELARFTRSGRQADPTDSSLWRWSSPRGGRALPATLRRGARTFLVTDRSPCRSRDRPTDSLACGV